MTRFTTNPELLKALTEAAGRKMTPEEVREQRISFVMGMIDEKSDVSRADVAKIIDDRDGKAA